MMMTSLADEPDLELAIGFLSTVFASAMDGGFVNLFTVEHRSGLRRTAWAPVSDIPSLRPAIESFARRGDVWFGCALRREILPAGQRGGVKDCLAIPGLWLDVDVAGPGHRLSGLASSYDAARLFIGRAGGKPSLVVRSGHGFQAWYLFPEMVEAEEALPILAQWRLTWLKLAAAAGIHIDDVWDLPRIMRLPGTRNFKGD